MTPGGLKREYGKRLIFFGGINTQRLPFATPAEVRREVLQVIDVLGEGGGYICGPDHHIKPDVPAINAVTLFDTARDLSPQLSSLKSQDGSPRPRPRGRSAGRTRP